MKSQRALLLSRASYWALGVAFAMTFAGAGAFAQAPRGAPADQPAAAQAADTVYSAAELDKLVAPIALYPDALLAQVLPASAYPIDIVQAQRWIDKNKAAVSKQDYSGVDGQSWDPAVKALVRFPEVVRKMNDDLDWTTDLGDAFVNQPKDVADAIQRMRAKADATGSLKTNPQQKVVKRTESNREVIVIESASPEVIYVPAYDPVQVYDPAASAIAAGLLTFGTAVAIGSIWNNNNYWNWGSGIVYPPVWPGYPAWRPPYAGWRPGQPVYPPGVRPPGNINIGNDINIGNNVGNNVRPWRPDSDRYRPGQGAKPGLRPENRPGARPGDGAGQLPGGGGLDRPGAGGGGLDRPGAGDRPATRPAQRPEARPAQRPESRPASRPETRPAPRPSQAKPGGAFGGVDAGRGAAQAFSNRGAQSFNRGPAMGARPGPVSRPSGGGGRGGFGGGGGGGGGRGGRR